MSDEYIGRETLLQSVFGMMDNAGKESIGKDDLQYAINKQDAADVALIVHGRWLNFTGNFSTAECNRCGELYEVSPDENPCEDFFSAFKQLYKFCPNCGAKMDGE